MNFVQLKQWLFNNLRNGEQSRRENNSILALTSLVMPDTSRVWGVDVSHWNRSPVDFKRMKDLYHLDFAIIKGCDGSITSRYFYENVASAKTAGVPFGIYDWLYPNNKVSITAQVQAWRAVEVATAPQLGTLIDAEWTTYNGAAANPSGTDLRLAHDKYFALSNASATTYTAKGYADTYLKGFDWTREPLWIANYGVTSPALPNGATTYQLWQFASTLDGWTLDPTGNQKLDGNYFNGTHAEFAARYGGTVTPPSIGFGYIKLRRYNSDAHIVKLKNFTAAHVTKGALTTVSSAAKGKAAQYAINGDGWATNKPLSLAASDGDLYNPVQYDGRPFINITRDGIIKASTVNDSTCYNLVSGTRWSVKAGVNVFANDTDPEHVIELNPRSAIGYTKNNEIILCVVDGRSASNRGVTLKELSAIMLEAGAWYAVEMDGGGSSALFVKDRIVNAPSDGSERAVINQLLIYETGEPPMTLGIAREALGNIASVRNAPDVSGAKVGTIPGGSSINFMALVNGSKVATDKWLKLSDGISYVNQFVTGKTYFTIISMPTLPPPPPPVADSVTMDITLRDVKVAGDVYSAVGVKATKTA